MATDLLSQVAQKYGSGNWNALRGSTDPLLQQMQKQYGADANWNSLRPSGAPGAAAAPQQPLSTAPATLPQPQGVRRTPDDNGGDYEPPAPAPTPAPAPPAPPPAPPAPAPPTPPAPPPAPANHPPLPPGWAIGSDGNPGHYRPDGGWQSVSWSEVPGSSATGGGGGGAGSNAGAKNPNSPDFDYTFGGHAGKDPWLPSTTLDPKTGKSAYDQYVDQIKASGVSEADAKATADSVFSTSLKQAMDLANQNAYGGQNKQTDPSYWLEMWKKDPAYTWDRLMGKGGGGSDAAKYGPWSGGDPNAEGAKNSTQFTNGDPLKSPLLAPWDTPFNYANFSSDAKYKPPDPFAPPTADDMLTDPGYTSRLREAQQAIERSASARGTLGTGGTLKDLTQFSQDYAANEYQDLYSRKLNEYLTSYNANLQNFQTLYGTDLNNWLTNYNKALGEYQQQYNIFEQNQAKQFNRLASLAGFGQTAAGSLGNAGANFANNAGLTLMSGARGLADYYTQAANARAAAQASQGGLYGNLFKDLFG